MKIEHDGLKECPFCGCRAGLYQAYDGLWCVQCDGCGMTTMYGDKDSVAKLWNRRVQESDTE